MAATRIFLASSSELKADRDAFEIFINRKNKEWHARGVFLQLIIWEDFLDAMSNTRLQDEYTRAIRECDIFVMLFATKVGKYTEEEFEEAFHQFTATGKPFIFTYFKDTPISTGSADRAELLSLLGFQEKLKELGHYQTVYTNTEGLQLHFGQQLEKLASTGFIRFERDTEEEKSTRGSTYEATLTGDGAIAQGPGALAAGRGAVVVGGNLTGTVNTGTQTTIHTGGGALIDHAAVRQDQPTLHLAVGARVHLAGQSVEREWLLDEVRPPVQHSLVEDGVVRIPGHVEDLRFGAQLDYPVREHAPGLHYERI